MTSTSVAADLQFHDVVQKLAKWCACHYPVKKAWIFGSRATGTHTPDSDLDIALEIDPRPNDTNIFATWIVENQKWQQELSALLPYQVHLELYDPTASERIVATAVDQHGIQAYARKHNANY